MNPGPQHVFSMLLHRLGPLLARPTGGTIQRYFNVLRRRGRHYVLRPVLWRFCSERRKLRSDILFQGYRVPIPLRPRRREERCRCRWRPYVTLVFEPDLRAPVPAASSFCTTSKPVAPLKVIHLAKLSKITKRQISFVINIYHVMR